MRQEIAALEESLKMEQSETKMERLMKGAAQMRAHELEDLFRDIRETVGQHCILFPAKVQPVREEELDQHRMMLPAQSMHDWLRLSGRTTYEPIQPVHMDALRMSIKRDQNHWKYNLHVYLQSGQGWAYSLSAKTFCALPKHARRDFAWRIANQIVEYIGEQHKGRG